jgi:predicted DNA-binding protein
MVADEAKLVTLAARLPVVLRERFEELAERRQLTESALLRRLVEREFAVGVDDVGRLAVAETVAETLRHERAEAERVAAERAARAAEAAAVEEAAARRRQEAQARRLKRIRQLEQTAGASVMQLEMGLRDYLVNNVPNLDPRRLQGHAFTLGELERWAAGQYRVEDLGELVTS